MLCWLLLAGAAVEAVEVTINAEFKMPPGGAGTAVHCRREGHRTMCRCAVVV